METSRFVTREVVSLRPGTRIAILAGVLLLLAALFLFFVPLEKGSRTGQPFHCGSAARPAQGDFAVAVCGELGDRFRFGAAFFALSAVVVGAGGLWAFGTERRVQRRELRDYDDE